MCDVLGISACIDEWDPDWDERCGSCLVEPQRWCYLEWRDVLNGFTSKKVYWIETICRIIEIVPLIFLTIGATFLALVGNSLNLMSALFCCSSSGPARRGSTYLIRMPWATQQKKSVRLKELSEDGVRAEFRTHLKPLIEKEMDPKQFSIALAHKDRYADPDHHLPNDSTHSGLRPVADPAFYYPVCHLYSDHSGSHVYVAQHPLKGDRWQDNRKDFFDFVHDVRASHVIHLWKDLDDTQSYLGKVDDKVRLDGRMGFSNFTALVTAEKEYETGRVRRVKLTKKDEPTLEILDNEIYYLSTVTHPMQKISLGRRVIAPHHLADWVRGIYQAENKGQVVIVDRNGRGPAGVFALAYLIYSDYFYGEDPDLILNTTKRLLGDVDGRRGLITTEDEYLLVCQTVHHLIKTIKQ